MPLLSRRWRLLRCFFIDGLLFALFRCYGVSMMLMPLPPFRRLPLIAFRRYISVAAMLLYAMLLAAGNTARCRYAAKLLVAAVTPLLFYAMPLRFSLSLLLAAYSLIFASVYFAAFD